MAPDSEIDSAELLGEWIHSHEEDDGDRMVFRRSGFAFPPSRGRTGFALLPDGEARTYHPGPLDRGEADSGHWSLDGRTLTIVAPGSSGAFDIEAVGNESLVVRRQER